jgi:hypothetical protein
MVQDPGNGYCNSGVSPPTKVHPEFFAKDFLRHGRETYTMILWLLYYQRYNFKAKTDSKIDLQESTLNVKRPGYNNFQVF